MHGREVKKLSELDESGNPIVNAGDEDESEEEIIIAESLCEPTEMLYMLELMLAFHAWYKMGHLFCLKTKTDKANMLNENRTMMNEILDNAPRYDKNGWKLQKFHDMLHIGRDIKIFGSPNNVDAAPNENNLIEFANRPGKRAQKKRGFCLTS